MPQAKNISTAVAPFPDCHYRYEGLLDPADYSPDLPYNTLRQIYHERPIIRDFTVLIVKDGRVEVRPYCTYLRFCGRRHYLKTEASSYFSYANGRCSRTRLDECAGGNLQDILCRLGVGWVGELPRNLKDYAFQPKIFALILQGKVTDDVSLVAAVMKTYWRMRPVEPKLFLDYISAVGGLSSARSFPVLRDFTKDPETAMRFCLAMKATGSENTPFGVRLFDEMLSLARSRDFVWDFNRPQAEVLQDYGARLVQCHREELDKLSDKPLFLPQELASVTAPNIRLLNSYREMAEANCRFLRESKSQHSPHLCFHLTSPQECIFSVYVNLFGRCVVDAIESYEPLDYEALEYIRTFADTHVEQLLALEETRKKREGFEEIVELPPIPGIPDLSGLPF